jgi:hypothetical protein
VASGGLAPHILNLGNGLKAAMNFTFPYEVPAGGYQNGYAYVIAEYSLMSLSGTKPQSPDVRPVVTPYCPV